MDVRTPATALAGILYFCRQRAVGTLDDVRWLRTYEGGVRCVWRAATCLARTPLCSSCVVIAWSHSVLWEVRGRVRCGVAVGVEWDSEVGREELCERFGEVGAVHLVVDDPEAGEDGLVELSAYVWRGAEVEAVGVGAEEEDFLHHCQDGVDFG